MAAWSPAHPSTTCDAGRRLPIQIRIGVKETERSRIAHALNGQEINGQTVGLSVLMADKMKTLAQIASFGDAVNDVELIPPDLADLYVATSDSVDGSEA